MEGTNVSREIPLGDFKRLAVSQMRRLLVAARQAEEIKLGGGFVSRDEALVIRRMTLSQMVDDVAEFAKAMESHFPSLGGIATKVEGLLNGIVTAEDANALLVAFQQMMDTFQIGDDTSPEQGFGLSADTGGVQLSAHGIPDNDTGLSLKALQSQHDDQVFLRTVANRIAMNREDNKTPSREDLAAISAAYRLLDRGVTLPQDYLSIGTYGYRRHQTRLSLADPGDGHLSVTCADARLLDGVIVHVEHIDRDGVEDREVVEAYRLPAAINAARVRLHSGTAAPCTAYIGRPLFENGTSIRLRTDVPIYMPVGFNFDLLKTAHTTASSCTAMFINGIADCKIAIERMGVKDTLVFMTAVAGNVMRDPSRQFLSAAFNLNLPVWDDREALPRLVVNSYEIAQLAIEMAIAGQFDKVTWDGASNRVPSDPVLKQLSHAQWVTLIHTAHEQGLETYISAGLKPPDMRACVEIGVDGVGIGTSLHYTAPSRPMGQLKPEAILQTLQVRNEAEETIRGKAARMLARLDRMFFEKTLPMDSDEARKRLFTALRDEDEAAMTAELQALPKQLQSDGHEPANLNPVINRAKRVVQSDANNPIGRRLLGASAWDAHVQTVRDLLSVNDVSGLREVMR